MKMFESMRIPSIKRFRISGGVALYENEAFKAGFTFLANMLGNLSVKETISHATLNKDVNI